MVPRPYCVKDRSGLVCSYSDALNALRGSGPSHTLPERGCSLYQGTRMSFAKPWEHEQTYFGGNTTFAKCFQHASATPLLNLVHLL